MDMSSVNWLAILVATLIPFAIGFLWYGPLFGKLWMASVGLSEQDVSNMQPAKVFGTAFVAQLIMAFCLWMFFYGNPDVDDAITGGTGAFYGFLTGFGWVSTAICTNAMFEQRSFKYVAITSSYWIVVFTLMGLILGVWK